MAALEGRVPENSSCPTTSSKACTRRAALVTDVEVVDDYPASVLTHAGGNTDDAR